jgi:Carboxypeptidase regulatory-like domain
MLDEGRMFFEGGRMVCRVSRTLCGRIAITATLFLLTATPAIWAQHGSEGTVTITVLDPSGSIVPGAQLQLQDLATNDVRKATTQEKGTYTFVNLSLGRYKLTVSNPGFKSQIFNDVVVQAAQTTDIKVTLQVGTVSETVEVNGGAAPLVETTANAIGTTVDLKQIESLPIYGRDLTQLANIVPGYTGTWDGLPSIAEGNNIDGVIGSTSRMKFGGNAEPNVMPRLENIQEMTVQTEQLNLDQGFGQANMQINFVTRRGGNAFHGRLYEDFRNAWLNANSWYNDNVGLPKNSLILNEFGGSLGGPIIKDKLFFFGTFAMGKQPGTINATNYAFTQAAQSGVFTYGAGQVNLFTLAANYNAAHPGANLPTQVLSDGSGNCAPNASNTPAEVLCSVNSSLKYGALSPNANGDPNLDQIGWLVPAPITHYWPTVRVDYDATQKLRFNFALNITKDNYQGANVPDFPGPAWAKTGAGNKDTNYTAAFGFDWTLSATMVNNFRGGFLYNSNIGAYNAPPLLQNLPQLAWNYTSVNANPYSSQMSGTIFYTGINTYYPVFNASDTMTWQHHAHTVNFGFSWWREQDHYYNPVLGYPVASFGLSPGDPAQNAFLAGTTLPGATTGEQAEAQQLYAILAGRIGSASGSSAVSGSYSFSPSQNQYVPAIGRYNLDELERAWGLYFQDSWRVKSNLTVNYGLRWDFTGADKDLSNLYHSASTASVWGPSGINNLFNPGSLQGDLNPQIAQISQSYNNWNVSPQPAIGIAWNPKYDEGVLGKLTGGEKTVIRAGYSLRKFTEPQQYVWNQASDFASFYYQSFFLNANTSGAPGTFVPGSLSIANFNSSVTGSGAEDAFGIPYGVSPKTFLKTESASDFTFNGGPGLNGIKYNIQQPYTQSWNLGIQRAIGSTSALEVRYVGSRTLRQWIQLDPNEVNIFENGFLTQFKQAQANLAANNASGIASYAGSFANHGLPGQGPMPIIDSAFVGASEFSSPCADGSAADYCNGQFITELQNGAAGGMAYTLANVNGTTPYFCNLVGASFGPCANNLGFTGNGAGYPINVLQTNPYAANTGFVNSVSTTLSEAEGYSNYNALQVDFRQRNFHGLQFDANYTWSHTLGIASQNNWTAATNIFTLRDMRLTYGPALYDLRHVIHINGTYDLPFGRGKMFANRGGVVNEVVGGWTVGTIFSFQSGTPFLLGSGVQYSPNLTFNDYGDAGVVLNGVTRSQLQSSIGKYPIPSTPTVAFINPKYLTLGSGSNSAYITQNTTPGTIGQRVWLYGPHNTLDDISISKNFPITERVHFIFQTEMLNAFNHPVFGPGVGNGGTYGNFVSPGSNAGTGFSSNVLSSGFGIATGPLNPENLPTGGARLIELRGNIEF